MPMPITPATILAAVLFGALSAYLAHRRKKNPYKWFLIGFFFGIFGLFAVLFMSPKKKALPLKMVVPPMVPMIQGPSDKLWYYLDPTHQQHGPMSHNGLTSALREGKISLSTYVWNEEWTEWKVLQELVKN